MIKILTRNMEKQILMLVIDPKIDTTTYIFHHLFLCRVPYLATMSVDYIKKFGIPSSGDKEIDVEMSRQMVTTYLPISEMVKYHTEGFTVAIVNRSDIKDIYMLVSNHLSAWKRYIEKSINLGNAPMKDLIALDQFATTVYNEAKFEFPVESAQSTFLQHMSLTIRTNKENFYKQKSEQPSLDKDGNLRVHGLEEHVYPERQSLSDIFRNRRIGNKDF